MKDLFEELCKGCNAKALYDEEYCDACTLKDDIAEHDAKIRAEAVEEAAVLIRQFTREWNMTNHKRISYIASDELISYLRNHMKEQSNAK